MFSHRHRFAVTALLLLTTACSKNNSSSTTTTPSCVVSTGQVSTSSFGPEGGTGSVTVTAGSGCTWTATSSAGFITISQGASGSGNGTVTFTVATNTATSARTGTLTVAGTAFTITQRAAATPPPTGTLSAPTPNSPIGGASITGTRPTLLVNNAEATGTVGTVTYRFEVSDLPSFPNDPVRTFTQDAIVQGTTTTSWVVNRDLGPDVLWYWHARATNGTITTDYSATETFRTPTTCSYTVSPTSASVNSGGGTVTITVTTGSTCAWTATSNASFITVMSGASGTGNGTVTLIVPANGPAARSGMVTIATQTVTINQPASGIVAAFRMRDPSVSGASPTTECRITSAYASTCVLESMSFPLGTSVLTTYTWTVQYMYGTNKTLTQTGVNSTISITDTCGGPGSTSDGAPQPLSVTLIVNDDQGNTATATSGSGNQPPLFLRLFKC